MGIRTLSNAGEGLAVLYDSVTGIAFGPVWSDNFDLGEGRPVGGADDIASHFWQWAIETNFPQVRHHFLTDEQWRELQQLYFTAFTGMVIELDGDQYVAISPETATE